MPIKKFYPIWFAQTISIIGSELTKFAIPLWLLSTGISTTFFSTIVVITMLPRSLFGLFVGPLVDEGPKKKILISAEIIQGLSIIAMLIIYLNGFNKLQFLFALFIHSSSSLFSYPIISSLVPQLLSDDEIPKANSMLAATDSASLLIAPLVGGALVFYKKLEIIFALDIFSFIFNICILLKFLPTLPYRGITKTNVFKSIKEGLQFFKQESHLTKFLIISTVTNFSLSISFYLAPALLLEISNDARIVGTIQTFGGVSQLIALWIIGFNFRPKKLAKFELIGTLIFAIIGPICIALLNRNIIIYISYVIALLILPVLNVWNRTLWQTKVPKEMLGRVFATKRFVSSMLTPLTTLISGWSIDHLLIARLNMNLVNSYKTLFFISGAILIFFSLISLNSSWRKRLDNEVL